MADLARKDLDLDLIHIQSATGKNLAETRLIKGLIIKTETIGEKRAKRFVATLKDHTGTIELVWFQGLKWVSDFVKAGEQYVVFGKPTDFKGKFSFSHPEICFIK